MSIDVHLCENFNKWNSIQFFFYYLVCRMQNFSFDFSHSIINSHVRNENKCHAVCCASSKSIIYNPSIHPLSYDTYQTLNTREQIRIYLCWRWGLSIKKSIIQPQNLSFKCYNLRWRIYINIILYVNVKGIKRLHAICISYLTDLDPNG